MGWVGGPYAPKMLALPIIDIVRGDVTVTQSDQTEQLIFEDILGSENGWKVTTFNSLLNTIKRNLKTKIKITKMQKIERKETRKFLPGVGPQIKK